MDPQRRSFKASNGTQGHSNSTVVSHDLDDKPVLLNRDDGEHHRGEVVVKIDGNSHNGGGFELPSPPADVSNPRTVQRNSSYRFWNEEDGNRPRGGGGNAATAHDEKRTFSFTGQQGGISETEFGEDPPSLLISTFLNKQRAAGSELALDMDTDMDELRKNSPTLASCPKDLLVSFKTPATDLPLDRSSSSPSSDDEGHGTGLRQRKAPRSPGTGNDGYGEVLHCTSNSSIHPGRPTSSLLLGKTRSRLIDPTLPPLPTTGVASPAVMAAAVANEDARKSGRGQHTGQLRSGQIRSGFIGKSQVMDDDDTESFTEEDIPEQYKRIEFSCWSFLQWVSLIVIIAALTCSLAMERLKHLEPLGLHFWKWLLFLLLLICGRLVSGWLVRFVVFCIERKFFRLRKRVLYFVYGVRHAVQNCLWLTLVLISWHLMLDKEVRLKIQRTALPYVSNVTKILFCLLVATLLRLVKTLLVKVLASSFHVSTYFDRIQESLFNQYVIETLSGPPLMEIQAIKEEEEHMMAEVQKLQKAGARMSSELQAMALPSQGTKTTNCVGRKSGMIGITAKLNKDGKQQDEGITIEELHKLNQKNISAGRMKRLMRIVRYGTLTTLDEKILQHSGEDESTKQIRSELEAKAAARKIFSNVARPRAKYIYLQDLMRFMTPEEAAKTISMFDGGQQANRASRRSLKNWVVNAFRERRALALTLNDTKTAVNKLHHMANFVVGVIIIAIWLVIMGIATSHFFVFLSSQALLLVFIFGNTLKTVFEALIFLFVMHPFDVGDRCEVEGVQMIVEEMNIMTTIFLRFDNQKITYPNSVLATLPIGNFYRSPDMGDSIDFCIHVATPLEKITTMRERLLAYMESKKEHWHPGAMVVLRDVDDMNRLKLSVWMRQRINFQDMGMRYGRRELVVQEIVKVARDLDIEYRMLPLDVNVRNIPSTPQCTSARVPSTWAAG